MLHLFTHIHGYIAGQLRDLDPKATAGLGMIASMLPSADQITRVMGWVALAVGIYCSVSRERRDVRRERDQAKASGESPGSTPTHAAGG